MLRQAQRSAGGERFEFSIRGGMPRPPLGPRAARAITYRGAEHMPRALLGLAGRAAAAARRAGISGLQMSPQTKERKLAVITSP